MKKRKARLLARPATPLLPALLLTVLTACAIAPGPQPESDPQPEPTAVEVVSPTDPNIFTSLSNWRTMSSYIQTNNTGAYLKMGFTGQTLRVRFDTSAFDAANKLAIDYPIVRTVVDGFTRTFQLTSGSPTIDVGGTLAPGNHTLELGFVSTRISFDRWNGPANVLRITGFELSEGAATFAPSLRPKRMLFFSDSGGEGFRILAKNDAPRYSDALQSYGRLTANALNAEVGNISFANQGWAVSGAGNVPSFHIPPQSLRAWQRYDGTSSRLPLSPEPDYIVVAHGFNDFLQNVPDATVTERASSFLPALRSAAPNASIFLMVPARGSKREALQSAYTAYRNDVPSDNKVYFIDLGQAAAEIFNNNSTDGGFHMNVSGHQQLAALLINALNDVIGEPPPPLPDDSLSPSAIIRIDNLRGSVSDIQDDPDAPDSLFLTATRSTRMEQLIVRFPNAAEALKTGSALQEFKVFVRKTVGSGEPSIRLEVRQNGVQRVVSPYARITSTSGQVVSYRWDASRLSDISGSGVELRLISTPVENTYIDVGAVEWNPEYN